MAWHFAGWTLDRGERAELLKAFPPRYGDVIADHVTLATGTKPLSAPGPAHARVVGEADDGAGVQALVVEIDGTSRRPDGARYHITWSIDRTRGRKPVDSNAVIGVHGWTPLPSPRPITLRPKAS
jgi:hypothetical protein